MVITFVPLHSTTNELRFCEGSEPARDMSGIGDGGNLLQWSLLEKKLKPLSANPTKWSNTLTQFVSKSRRIV